MEKEKKCHQGELLRTRQKALKEAKGTTYQSRGFQNTFRHSSGQITTIWVTVMVTGGGNVYENLALIVFCDVRAFA